MLEWGSPGRVLLVDGRTAGWALLVPGSLAAGVRRLPRQPSHDALLLATLWVDPEARRGGLARVLLQTVLRDAHERGSAAVEAYGARVAAPGYCLLPEPFLLASGFSLLHDDHRMPLLRLELRRTARWQRSVTGALEQVLDALPRRRVAPAPARPNSAVRRAGG